MSDKELLELAAKAAGIKGRSTSFGFITMEAGYDADPLYWKPLTNDGDAFRLAVKLGLLIDTNYNHGVGVGSASFEEVFEDNSVDPYAATRRAIVRAAAEIGKRL